MFGRKKKKSGEAAAKAAKESKGLLGTLTDPKLAKRTVAVFKIAGPAVAPYALKASTGVRGLLDERKAGKLGVPAEDVALYTGPTAAISARIANLQTSIADLRRRRGGDLQVARFADVAKARLTDLGTAVQAAGSMPSGQRRATLHAIGRDLSQIEADLMTFLVGNPA